MRRHTRDGPCLLRESSHHQRGMEGAVERAVRTALLLMILLLTFVLPPMWLRRRTVVHVGPMLRAMCAWVLVYVVALLVIYPRLP